MRFFFLRKCFRFLLVVALVINGPIAQANIVDTTKNALSAIDATKVDREVFNAKFDEESLGRLIRDWLTPEGSTSSVVTSLLSYTKENVGTQLTARMVEIFAPATEKSEARFINFIYNSTSLGSPLNVVCTMHVQYSSGNVVVKSCHYLEQFKEDVGLVDWFRKANGNDYELVPLSNLYDGPLANSTAASLSPILTADFEQILNKDRKLCNSDDPNSYDFNLEIVTGSEKFKFLERAKVLYKAGGFNWIGDDCFEINIVPQGSVASALAVKKNYLQTKTNPSAKYPEGIKYPTIWTPASKVYEELAFKDNPVGGFADGLPLLRSPLVFFLEDRHSEALKAIKPKGKISDDDPDDGPFQGLVVGVEENEDHFSDDEKSTFGNFPTVLGLYEIIRRADIGDPNAIIEKPKGARGRRRAGSGAQAKRFQFQITNPAVSNSGNHYAVIMGLEYFISILGINPMFDPVKQDLTDEQWMPVVDDPQFENFVTEAATRLRSAYKSTGTLGTQTAESDAIQGSFIYESDAIRVAQSFDTDKYDVIYPFTNAENDHPMYILEGRATGVQVAAAKKFIKFLRQREQQLLAMSSFGFRPLKSAVKGKDLELVKSTFGEFTATLGIAPDLEETGIEYISTPPGPVVDKILELIRTPEDENRLEEEIENIGQKS